MKCVTVVLIVVFILCQTGTGKVGLILGHNGMSSIIGQSINADKPPPALALMNLNWSVLLDGAGVLVLTKDSINVAFSFMVTCTAIYPVQFVYEVNEMNLNTEPVDFGFRTKLYYDDFNDFSTYIFYTRNVFRFAAVTNPTNFSCQQVSNPCLQHQVEFNFVNSNPNELTTTLRESGDQCASLLLTKAEGSNPVKRASLDDLVDDYTDNEACDANFYYQISLDDGFYTWALRCQFSADGSPGIIKRFECSNSIKCGNLLRKGSQKTCWILRPDTKANCSQCQIEKVQNFNPFVAICTKTDDTNGRYVESEIGALGFYGVVTDENPRPPLFFDPNNINETAMIYLEEVKVVEGYLNLGCRTSGYYNSATFQFALEIEGDSNLRMLPKGLDNQTVWRSGLGAWVQKYSTRLDTNHKITRIFCFGHVLNSYRWINDSRPFKIDQGSVPPTPSDDHGNGSRLTIILISVALAGIAILSLYLVIERRWGKSTKVVRDLRRHEIKQFLDGSPHYQVAKCPHCSSDVEMPLYCLPYNPKFETHRQNIQLDKTEELGKGEFGRVVLGTLLTGEGKKIVAIKTTKGNVHVKEFLAFLSEIKVMAQLDSHPNIVGLVAACTASMKKRVALVALEYCANGNLKTFLKKNQDNFQNLFPAGTPHKLKSNSEIVDDHSPYTRFDQLVAPALEPQFTTLTLMEFACGIANGLCYLSEKMIIHGDIAARNILLDENLEAKISDFGLSSLLLSNSNYVKKQGDKIPWKHMPIEALRDGKVSIQSDIWAYGVTLWEIFALGKKPYENFFFGEEFFQSLASGYRMTRPPYANADIYAIMTDCWKEERRDRPPFCQIYGRILEISESILENQPLHSQTAETSNISCYVEN